MGQEEVIALIEWQRVSPFFVFQPSTTKPAETSVLSLGCTHTLQTALLRLPGCCPLPHRFTAMHAKKRSGAPTRARRTLAGHRHNGIGHKLVLHDNDRSREGIESQQARPRRNLQGLRFVLVHSPLVGARAATASAWVIGSTWEVLFVYPVSRFDLPFQRR
jgi:hypothetical protein